MLCKEINIMAQIVLNIQNSGTLKISNKWSTNIIVNSTSISPNGYASITVTSGNTITISESIDGDTFRTWTNYASPLISGINCSITSMPDMSAFTTDEAGTIAGDYFFSNFNNSGTITSLPDGSFNTGNITTVGNYFFSGFNQSGALTSLPDGSFYISNITTVGNYFFYNFNYSGILTNLPDGSFNTKNIITIGTYFFYGFNYSGKLISLPDNSFNIDGITAVGNFFFSYFNYSGKLTSLPDGSFNTKNITTIIGNSS
jgi:hypothetical protein